MTDSNIPSNAPIILTLDAPRAAMLMRATSAYSCADFQARFDYGVAELIFWQAIHGEVLNGSDDSELADTARRVHSMVAELVANSIQEDLNE